MRCAPLAPIIAALAAGALLAGCDRDEKSEPGPAPDARSTLIRVADDTLAAGPSRVIATVRSRGVRYRVAGRLDPGAGYRLCGVIRAPAGQFLVGDLLWLEGEAGSHGTLTTRARSCVRSVLWFDDHPPTLPLSGGSGGEDFLHAALTALTGFRPATVPSARLLRCGDSDCVSAVVDFRALDRKPASRDEDAWTLRPLLRSLGRLPVTVRIDSEGRLSRIALDAFRVNVSVELSGYGGERGVPRVFARAIE